MLREAYNGFCKQNGGRALSTEAFGKACADMFGPRKRLSVTREDPIIIPIGATPVEWREKSDALRGRRPWGYDVPIGSTWQEKIDARLGIKK